MRGLVFAIGLLALVQPAGFTQEKESFESNIKVGAEVDIGIAKIIIEKVCEALITPVNSSQPTNSDYKFIIIDTTTSFIQDGQRITSAGFALIDINKTRYKCKGAYGEIELFGKMSAFEATDGAEAYAYSKDDPLNVFFEVPVDIFFIEFQIVYESPTE